MTEKALKRLSRSGLLEMLTAQMEENARAEDYSRRMRSAVRLYQKQAAEKIAALLREKEDVTPLLYPNKEGNPA